MLTLLVGVMAVLPWESMQKPLDEALARVKKEWETALTQVLRVGDDEAKIEHFMRGKYRDKAALHWGGVGDRRLYYLIDDYLQVYFELEFTGAGDKLKSAPKVEKKGAWLKRPDGRLWNIPAGEVKGK
jgi:hypothetical protein